MESYSTEGKSSPKSLSVKVPSMFAIYCALITKGDVKLYVNFPNTVFLQALFNFVMQN